MIILNFKAYPSSTGVNAVRLAEICEEVSLETGVQIIVAPSILDFSEVRKTVNIDVYCQHIDNIEPGPYTGYTSAHHARSRGADGTILNHAEHKLSWEVLVETVSKAKEQGLGVVLCAETIDFAVKELELFPNEIALEIPELIGGSISISKANPALIKKAVHRIGEGKILAGAGIKTADDVKAALDMGVKGVILASAFDLAINARKEIMSLAKAFI